MGANCNFESFLRIYLALYNMEFHSFVLGNGKTDNMVGHYVNIFMGMVILQAINILGNYIW